MKATELRLGTLVHCELEIIKGVPEKFIVEIEGITKFNANDFRIYVRGKNNDLPNIIGEASLEQLSGIPLTEENILKFRRVDRPDFCPVEFGAYEPGERQLEKQYWSSWIHDYNKLHLCPSYDHHYAEDGKTRIKHTIPTFWFTWYCDGGKFVSVKDIRGDNMMKYVHDLQNLFFPISGKELIWRL